MEFKNERKRYFDALICTGEILSLQSMNDFGVNVPNKIKERWLKKTRENNALTFPKEPRLINHFSLGADPEFVFTDDRGRYVHAEKQGLDTLSAFGCDMAGRQAELRAYPSRSALAVVASLIDTLRWMNAATDTHKLIWLGTPFFERDGCAGHIHFGRKRPRRENEIKALDRVTRLLINAGVWIEEDLINRKNIAGYGKPGDYRLQSYGYEYRSTPTWMCDPWLAFFVITISKLAMYHGTEIPATNNKVTAWQQLLNLLDAYKGIDDDARLARRGFNVLGYPQYKAGDFKERWGINPLSKYKIKYNRHYIPYVIKPSPQTLLELFDYINIGLAIKKRDPEVTWQLFELPNNLHKIEIVPHRPGAMDIGKGLVSNLKIQININDTNYCMFYSTKPLNWAAIQQAFKERVPKYKYKINHQIMELGNGYNLLIYIPQNIMRQNFNHSVDSVFVEQIRSVISDPTLFPICKVKDYKQGIFNNQRVPIEASKIKRLGKKESFIGMQKQEVKPKLPNKKYLAIDMEAVENLQQAAQIYQWGVEDIPNDEF